jgi:hypothetical protein
MAGEGWGQQMTAALSAVRQMHRDSSRLLRDLDRFLAGFKPVFGSFATTDLSYDIKKGDYMAAGLLRHWVHSESPSEVIAVNIVFWDRSPKVRATGPTI